MFEDEGFCEVAYAIEADGPFTVVGQTTSKITSNFLVEGLEADTVYYFVIRSYTFEHDEQ